MVKKILVVEDDKAVSKLLFSFLSKSGFYTKIAECAEDAEKILNSEKIHEFCMNLKLPQASNPSHTIFLQLLRFY